MLTATLIMQVTFSSVAAVGTGELIQDPGHHAASGSDASEQYLSTDKANEADAVLDVNAVFEADTGNDPEESMSVQSEAISTEAAIAPAVQQPCITPAAAEVVSGSPLRLYRQDFGPPEPEKSPPSRMIPLQTAAGDQLRQESAGAKFLRAIQQTLESVYRAMAPSKVHGWGSLGFPLPSTSTGVEVRVLRSST